MIASNQRLPSLAQGQVLGLKILYMIQVLLIVKNEITEKISKTLETSLSQEFVKSGDF